MLVHGYCYAWTRGFGERSMWVVFREIFRGYSLGFFYCLGGWISMAGRKVVTVNLKESIQGVVSPSIYIFRFPSHQSTISPTHSAGTQRTMDSSWGNMKILSKDLEYHLVWIKRTRHTSSSQCTLRYPLRIRFWGNQITYSNFLRTQGHLQLLQ